MKPLAAGERVSYGLRHAVERDTTVATLPDRLRRRGVPAARAGGPGGADRRPPPPDDRRGHHGPGARGRRSRQRRARSATRRCCSARRARSASRRTSGPPGSAPSPTRWCARSAQGSSAGTDARRLLRRDRGRHHRLRRRDARPGRRGVVAGPAGRRRSCWPATSAPARRRSSRASAAGLGVTDRITSPTFTLVHVYEGRLPVHHLDVYRLEQLSEALDLGLPEMLDEGGVVLIEWGDAILPVLPHDFLEVRLTFGDRRRRPPRRPSVPSAPRWALARRRAGRRAQPLAGGGR